MQRFFESVLEPIFKAEGIKTIVEIGADKGYNTAKLIRYANSCKGKIYSIDPVPGFDSDTWEKENPDTFVMVKDLSLNAIKDIKDADCFLIDGDHNWYTVYHELKMIYDTYGDEKFPLVFFHDILWPYDRRDLYYSPDNIPAIYLNEYEKKAMKPGCDELCNDGINERLSNAKKYGGEKNGVLTAVEDFVRDYPSLGLKFMAHDVLFGLGMIAADKRYPEAIKHFYSAEALKGTMKVCERERLDRMVEVKTLIKKINAYTNAEKRNQIAKFYPDFGEGYSESTAVFTGEYDAESGYYYGKVVFDRPPVSVRFDPVNESYCVLSDLSIITSSGRLEPAKTNGKCFNDTYVFTTTDPQIIFENKCNSREFKIKAQICPFKNISAAETIIELLESNNSLTEDNNQLSEENKNLISAKNELLKANSTLLSERNDLQNEKNSSSKQLSSLNQQVSSLKESLKKTELSFNDAKKKNSALAEEVKKEKKSASDANAALQQNKRIAQQLYKGKKKIGWKHAAKSVFSHGLFATRTNIKAIKEISKNGGFDPVFYYAKNKDVLEKGIDPLMHFIWFGGYEGRNPSEDFDTKKYLARYADVKNSKVNPYAHYLVCGKSEKRKTFPVTQKNNAPSKDISPLIVKEEIKSNTIQNTASNYEDGEILTAYREFYNYSAHSPLLYPQKSEADSKIFSFMNSYKNSILELYRNIDQNVKVSIIMPTYNRVSVISEAIKSVINQSYKNWELLVIDDGSEDNTEELVRKYCNEDSRIHFLKNNRKKGVCGARNTGLESAKGEYIAYLDTDNDWDEDYLLAMVNTLKINPEYSAIYSAQKIYRPENSKMTFQYIRFGAYNHSLIKNKNYIDMNCYMHRKESYEKFGGFSEELKRFVDWELIHRYGAHNAPLALPCCLSNYYFENADNQITEHSMEAYRENIAKFDSAIKGANLELTSAANLDINGYEFYSDSIDKYDCGKRNVSIIIPSYEALSCLITCIEAIKKFTADVNYEIIIVDNNSSDIVKEYLQLLDKNDEKVKIHLNEHNMGFTYAVNQGIEMAMKDSDIILLNNDAIVTDGWIEELYRVKDKVNAGIIVPRQVLIPETKTMTVHIPNGNQKRELDVSVSKHHHNIKNLNKYHNFGFTELSFAPFFLVMITRECFDKLGYLDEKNGRHYKSDRLYCQKAEENNIEIVYTPFSKAYHLLQQSTAALKESDVQMYKTIFVKNDWSDIGYTKKHQ